MNAFINQEMSLPLTPLAERMRPRQLSEFLGQEHIVGPGMLLRNAIETGNVQSCIFWGPPGCGKTTLASVIAKTAQGLFVKLNAVSSGVADVRKLMDEANVNRAAGIKTYLLLDECHRWNKSQSDCLLPALESGLIRLIGSTTENPSVSMTPAIVSRCRIYAFKALTSADTLKALQCAASDAERGLGQENYLYEDGVLEYIAQETGGDVRAALSALEAASLSGTWVADADEKPKIKITKSDARQSLQKPNLNIDKQTYYDMLSAFCKSMRGSDPDAALLWFSRMLYAGVDPKLIVRRIVVHASEDVGLADPIAMLQAQAAVTALEFVGMPEARIPIAQAIIAVCMAEKSDSVVQALSAAEADVAKGQFTGVPEYLRDKSYAVEHKNNQNYCYPHHCPNHFVIQNYMPSGMENRVYYHPSMQGHEAKLKQRHITRYGVQHEKNR